MILLDTNIVSELWKPQPEPRVLAWLDAQALETLYLSTITMAELRFGIAAMPQSKRQAVLHERLETEVLPLFSGRILAFDLDASKSYASLMADARRAGKSIGLADGLIAAIAYSHGLFVATRDISPFQACNVKTINPWAFEA